MDPSISLPSAATFKGIHVSDVVPFSNTVSLRQALVAHGVVVGRGSRTRASLSALLRGHSCTSVCADVFYQFAPCSSTQRPSMSVTPPLVPLDASAPTPLPTLPAACAMPSSVVLTSESPSTLPGPCPELDGPADCHTDQTSGADPDRVTCRCRKLCVPSSILENGALCSGVAPPPLAFLHYVSCDVVSSCRSPSSPDIVARLPVDTVVPFCNLNQLVSLARMHCISVPASKRSRESILSSIGVHNCGIACAKLVYFFDHACNSTQVTSPPVQAFPPLPTSVLSKAEIVTEWCSESSLSFVSELPCAVCASLSPVDDLTRVACSDLNLDPLVRPGVACLERFDACTPVADLSAPILFDGGIKIVDGVRQVDVCGLCLRTLQRNALPTRSLANGRWVGSTPACLLDLSYVEQLVIAKFRHSFCVAQVSRSHQRYLAANVIVFGQPIDRVYDVLPPPARI
ncbi:hypothetical protein C8Q78DRAFT_1113376 [Trametes maxima]|nr:hypothetical protein C8Q78DRAFT_1113376 [Trametes maxima]